MPLSRQRIVFGIHSIVPYDRTDESPFGILLVLSGGEIALEAERVELFGGSNRFPFASEQTIIDSEFTFTIGEYPDFIFELFLGATVSTTAPEASGSINNLSNKKGTSVVDASTGIASIAVTTPADLKFGRYAFRAVSGTEVDIFSLGNIDVNRGAALDLDDSLKIVNESPITIPGASASVAVPSIGVTITGGSGSIAMVTDDTGFFDIFTPHTGVSVISVGQTGTIFPEFGARMIAAKASSGDLFEINVFRANGSGAPISLSQNEFSEPELSMKLLFDSVQDKVFELIALRP